MPCLRAMPEDVSLRSFVIAGGIMAVAVALRAALDRVLPGLPPFITLYPAVALSGLLVGPLAGGVFGVVGVIAAVYLWIPPRMSFGLPSPTACVGLALFLAASGVILWIAALQRAQLSAARVAGYALDLGLAAGGVGTWEFNLRTHRITASAAAHALHFLPPDAQTAPEDWRRGVPAEDVGVLSETLREAVTKGGQASYTYRIFGGTEGPRWISARGGVITTGGEKRLLCALVDITDQIRVQEDLRHERERLRLALAAGSLAVWDYHPETRLATVDTRYARKLGFDAGVHSLSRDQIGARMHPEDRKLVAARHEAMVAAGGNYLVEYRIFNETGEIRWLRSQGVAIHDGGPAAAPRLVGIIQDITDQKQREDELREQAEARELLIREADHRIKNSLQLVISLLTVQLRGVEDPAAVEALRGAITRVGAIAASHLALQGSADLRQVDLAVTLTELCAHFSQLQPAINIVCGASEGLMLDADRAIPLSLAVSEVLTNALRHAFPGRESGTITVDAQADHAALIVRVSDDGVGIQPENDRAGLGSRIIRSLTTQLAATMHVNSTPQAGTTVTLRLALRQPEPAAA